MPRTLAFSLDETRIDGIQKSDWQDSFLIILDSKAPTCRDAFNYFRSIRHYCSFINSADYNAIRGDLAKAWSEILTASEHVGVDCYELNFSLLYTPFLFWKRAIRNAIREIAPDRLLLPSSCKAIDRLEVSENIFADLPDLTAWIRNYCLYQTANSAGVKLDFYDNSGASDKGYSQSRLSEQALFAGLSRLLSGLVSRTEYWISLAYQIVTSQSNQIWYRKPILIVAQKRKLNRILLTLSNNRIGFRVQSYQALYRSLRSYSGSQSTFTFIFGRSEALDLKQEIVCYLSAICDFHAEEIDPYISRYLEQFENTIITDGDHDPIIRRINTSIRSDEGRYLCTIPEGGIDLNRFPSFEGFRLAPHRHLIKLAVSKESSAVLSRAGASAYIGYDTSLAVSIIGKVIKYLLRNVFARGKIIVFYDYGLQHCSDIGIIRSLAVSSQNLLKSAQDISAHLKSGQYFVVSHRRGYREFTKSVSDSNFVHLDIHWSILARISDVVISEGSSIIRECISLKVPVIFYSSEVRGRNLFWDIEEAAGNNAAFQTVCDCKDLQKAILAAKNVTPEDYTRLDNVASKYSGQGLLAIIRRNHSRQ